MEENIQYIKPADIYKKYKITSITLARWADQGKIDYIKGPSGHRSYNVNSIISKDIVSNKVKSKISYCYCRVSTSGQRDDLKRQIEYMVTKYPTHKVVTDIGSGINFKRKGLQTILEQCVKGNVNEIVVAYKDRLCRFGYELYEWLFSVHGVKLVVLNSEISDPEKELTTDLLSIINVFSARANGRRKYSNKSSKKEKKCIEEKDIL